MGDRRPPVEPRPVAAPSTNASSAKPVKKFLKKGQGSLASTAKMSANPTMTTKPATTGKQKAHTTHEVNNPFDKYNFPSVPLVPAFSHYDPSHRLTTVREDSETGGKSRDSIDEDDRRDSGREEDSPEYRATSIPPRAGTARTTDSGYMHEEEVFSNVVSPRSERTGDSGRPEIFGNTLMHEETIRRGYASTSSQSDDGHSSRVFPPEPDNTAAFESVEAVVEQGGNNPEPIFSRKPWVENSATGSEHESRVNEDDMSTRNRMLAEREALISRNSGMVGKPPQNHAQSMDASHSNSTGISSPRHRSTPIHTEKKGPMMVVPPHEEYMLHDTDDENARQIALAARGEDATSSSDESARRAFSDIPLDTAFPSRLQQAGQINGRPPRVQEILPSESTRRGQAHPSAATRPTGGTLRRDTEQQTSVPYEPTLSEVEVVTPLPRPAHRTVFNPLHNETPSIPERRRVADRQSENRADTQTESDWKYRRAQKQLMDSQRDIIVYNDYQAKEMRIMNKIMRKMIAEKTAFDAEMIRERNLLSVEKQRLEKSSKRLKATEDAEIKRLNEDLDRANKQIRTLQEDKRMLLKKSKANEEEAKKANEEVATLKKAKEKLGENLAKANSRVAALKAEYNKKEEEYERKLALTATRNGRACNIRPALHKSSSANAIGMMTLPNATRLSNDDTHSSNGSQRKNVRWAGDHVSHTAEPVWGIIDRYSTANEHNVVMKSNDGHQTTLTQNPVCNCIIHRYDTGDLFWQDWTRSINMYAWKRNRHVEIRVGESMALAFEAGSFTFRRLVDRKRNVWLTTVWNDSESKHTDYLMKNDVQMVAREWDHARMQYTRTLIMNGLEQKEVLPMREESIFIYSSTHSVNLGRVDNIPNPTWSGPGYKISRDAYGTMNIKFATENYPSPGVQICIMNMGDYIKVLHFDEKNTKSLPCVDEEMV